jgi:peptide/nickel transport system substrate-binding protein
MRLTRLRGIAALGALALTLLTACSGGSAPAANKASTGTKLVVAETVPPQTFDPTQSSQIATMYAWQLVYNGLVKVDGGGKVQPEIATDWAVSDDRMTYDFTLRSGAKFSDGSPLTADDVEFSFQRLLTAGLPYAKARFPNLASVTKVDATHVRFQLKAADAGFLLNLGSPFLIGSGIVSKEWAASHDLKTEVLGAGPFQVVSYAPNSQLILKRNENYWNADDAPKYTDLQVKYMPDQAAQVAAVQSGQVDLIFPSAENALQLKNNNKVQISSVPGANTVRLNLNTGRAPFDNPDVRAAISLALDREAIVKGAFLDQAVPSAQLPPSTPWDLPLDQLANQTRDVNKAKQLLAAAGHPDGIDITLTHLAGYGTYLDRFADLVKTQLAEAGINVNIQAEQNAVWLDHQNNANYDILDNVYAFTGDPMSLLSPRPGRQGPTPPEVTALMAKAAQGDPAEYGANLQALMQLEDKLSFPDIAVASPNAMIAYGPNVTSATPDPTLARQFLTAVAVK